jgi:hypothetical protein
VRSVSLKTLVVALKYSVNCTQLKDLELDVCQPNLCGLTIIIAQ